jgi:hypothetical protein
VLSQIEWSGDLDEGERLLGDIRERLRPAASVLDRVPFLVIQTAIDQMFAAGNYSYGKNGFAQDISDDLIDVLVAHAGEIESPLDQIEVLSMGGAIARVDSDATAYPFRDARWLINIAAVWPTAGRSDYEIRWVRNGFAAAEPHLSDGAYVNFMGPEEDAAAALAYGSTLKRLQAVKATYDPENLFRLNQNVLPAASGRSDE